DPEALARYLGAVIQGLMVQASGGVGCEKLTKLVDTALMVWPGR
ncbi:MAG: TetR/AcrR family transcriptional regulator, partial [Caulobacteraceae bacterium]|nr:TetR/AcrR family transcriptional regulator [Caulobacteraceae bacterium]